MTDDEAMAEADLVVAAGLRGQIVRIIDDTETTVPEKLEQIREAIRGHDQAVLRQLWWDQNVKPIWKEGYELSKPLRFDLATLFLVLATSGVVAIGWLMLMGKQ